jgi:glutathione S-transferase
MTLNATPAPYLYYGADVSYFSGKVRPALYYKGLWFRETHPDMAEIYRRTGLRFIPVLVTPEDGTWQDTSDMLDRLEQRHPDPPLYPSTPVQRIAAYLIELYSDEVALLPAMHYRWSFEESAAKARVDFATTAGGNRELTDPFADRMSQACAMLGVGPDSIPAIEAHTRELLAALCAHFEEHAFLLGDAMSLADCGLMGPFYGHLYRDAVPGRLLRETALRVCAWIERMNRPDPARCTGWLADDALAPTLMAVLTVMGRDGAGFLCDSLRAFEAWADSNAKPGEAPPRGLGTHETSFRGAAFTRFTSSYTPWMVQRSLDAYRSLSPPERAGVDAALRGTGWEAVLAFEPRHRVVRRGFEIVVDS